MFQIFCGAPSRPERAAGSVSRCPSRPSPGAQRPVLGDFVTRTAALRGIGDVWKPGARHESTKTVAEKGHFVLRNIPIRDLFVFLRPARTGSRRRPPAGATLAPCRCKGAPRHPIGRLSRTVIHGAPQYRHGTFALCAVCCVGQVPRSRCAATPAMQKAVSFRTLFATVRHLVPKKSE